MPDEMMNAERRETKEMEMKEQNKAMEVIEVKESTASSEIGLQLVEAMKKVREAMCSVRLLLNFDFPKLVNKHEPTHAKSVSGFVDSVLGDPPYNVRSGCADANV